MRFAITSIMTFRDFKKAWGVKISEFDFRHKVLNRDSENSVDKVG